MNIKSVIIILLVFLLVFTLVIVKLLNNPNEKDEWVSNSLNEGDKLLCYKEINNDKFFVALSGSKVKTGSVLDTTTKSGIPISFIISWDFKTNNVRAKYISHPEDLISRDVKYKGSVYSEAIKLWNIDLNKVSAMTVSIGLRKYKDSSDVPKKIIDIESSGILKEYEICTFIINE